jgi:hypothetical protein
MMSGLLTRLVSSQRMTLRILEDTNDLLFLALDGSLDISGAQEIETPFVAYIASGDATGDRRLFTSDLSCLVRHANDLWRHQVSGAKGKEARSAQSSTASGKGASMELLPLFPTTKPMHAPRRGSLFPPHMQQPLAKGAWHRRKQEIGEA